MPPRGLTTAGRDHQITPCVPLRPTHGAKLVYSFGFGAPVGGLTNFADDLPTLAMLRHDDPAVVGCATWITPKGIARDIRRHLRQRKAQRHGFIMMPHPERRR